MSIRFKNKRIMQDKQEKQRTLKQNNALHLMFDQLAEELNDMGAYIPKVIKMEAQWDGDRVKELIWREVQKSATGKVSTTMLTTKEIDEIFGIIHLAFANKGIEIPPFPSVETLMMEMRTNEIHHVT